MVHLRDGPSLFGCNEDKDVLSYVSRIELGGSQVGRERVRVRERERERGASGIPHIHDTVLWHVPQDAPQCSPPSSDTLCKRKKLQSSDVHWMRANLPAWLPLNGGGQDDAVLQEQLG